jgi:hypothetical protein
VPPLCSWKACLEDDRVDRSDIVDSEECLQLNCQTCLDDSQVGNTMDDCTTMKVDVLSQRRKCSKDTLLQPCAGLAVYGANHRRQYNMFARL